MADPFDSQKFINAAQVGGIDSYVLDEGAGRGVRALCVNTGGGLRYRILVDRGFDIDHAFMNQHSLAFLTHKGVTPPAQGLERGLDWLKTFPGGLLTTCGPFNIGNPGADAGDDLALHGVHSNTPATVESIIQPEPHAGRLEMSAVARMRFGRLFGPCVEFKRTIRSVLGENVISITDEYFNAGNTPVPHAVLLHINFGYPLADEGTELFFDAHQLEPRPDAISKARYSNLATAKKLPGTLEAHRGGAETFAAFSPRGSGKSGQVSVAIANRARSLAVAIHYNTKEFPRCGNWQHFGPGEYVTALEPMNGTVLRGEKDQPSGAVDEIKAGGRKTYHYEIEAITDPDTLKKLQSLNGEDEGPRKKR